MRYMEMLKAAKKAGLTNEQKMWESVDSISELLETMKEEHPEEYWDFIRKQHCIMYGPHYDDLFAEYDVAKLKFTDANGVSHEGPHWTKEQVETATAGMKFPSGTTKCDVYVAMNAAYADFCKHFTEEQILQIGYDFFFADEDWTKDGKVWRYMAVNA